MKYFLLSAIIVLCSTQYSAGQTIETAQSGAWNDTNTWVGGTIPTDANSSLILINDSHDVNIPNGFTAIVDEVYVDLFGQITIDDGGILDLQDGTGDDLQVFNDGFDNGFFVINGRFILNQGATAVEEDSGPPGGSVLDRLTDFTTTVGSTGVFELAYTTSAGEIIGATWSLGSTVEITGYTTNTIVPVGLNQFFQNFTWNCTAQTANVDLSGGLLNVGGDFRISSTGAAGNRSLSLTNTTGNITMNIGGNFIIENNARVRAWGNATNVIIDIAGDLTLSTSNTTAFGSSGTGTVNLNDLNISNGTVRAATSNGGETSFNISGDFNFTSGSFDTDNDVGFTNLNFEGGTLQNFTSTGTVNPGDFFNYTVDNNSTVNLNTSLLTGVGSLTVNAGSILQLGSVSGSGAFDNNIQVTGGISLSSGSTIVLNGAGGQTLGSSYPSTSGVNLEIDNSGGVSLAANVTVGGNLNLVAGNLSIGGNTLTLEGSVSGSSSFETTSSSDLILNNTGSFTLPFASSTPELENLTINSTGAIISLEDELTISGILTLTDGDLDFAGQTLNLSGSVTGTGGFVSDGSSILNITGNGDLGTLSFSNSGNTLGTLNLNRLMTGSVTLGSTLNIMNALSLTAGTFNNPGGTLTMGDGSVLTKNSNASFTGGTPDTNPGENYNVVYEGGVITTGSEIPLGTETDVLGDLTISATTVNLDQDLTVNGNLSLTSGSFSIGANDLTVGGNLDRALGTSITPYTGEIIFDGTSTIIGQPNFVDIRLTSGSGLTFPSSNINVAGNITFISGSTFNANSGTITLNGSSNQNLNVGGSTINNLVVDNTATQVSISSNLNLLGELSFTVSNTADLSAGTGLLTILSTTDGPSGNGSIGEIPTGITVTGDINVQRFMSSAETPLFRYISSPITSGTVADWQDDFLISGTWTGADGISNDASMFIYDEPTVGDQNQGYEAYPDQSTGMATDPLTPSLGFAAFVRSGSQEVTDVTGPINQGDIVTNVSFTDDPGQTDDQDGWNLVGNPYPSSITWDNINPRTSGLGLAPIVYVSDNGSGTLSHRFYDNSGSSTFSGQIAQGQAFWVKAVSAGASLTLFESDKTSSTGEFFRTKESEFSGIEITLTGSGNWDKTFISIDESATRDYDPLMDGLKFINEKVSIYTHLSSGENLAINKLNSFDCSSDINLFVTELDEGAHTLEFHRLETLTDNYDLVLIDNFTSTETTLASGTIYDFEVTSDAGSFGGDRFIISVNAVAPDLTLNATGENTCEGNGSKVTIQNSESGVAYTLFIGDEQISEEIFGSGDDLDIEISADDLSSSAVNVVSIKASTAVCGEFQLTQTVEISNSEEVTITDLGDGLLSSSYETGNQWFFNDEIIEGATGQTYQATETGTYSVEVSFGSCNSRAQIAQAITSLNLEQEAITLFPNPAEDFVNLTFRSQESRVIRVVDLTGQLLKTESADGFNHSLDVSDLNDGIYFIHVDLETESFVYKVLKQ